MKRTTRTYVIQFFGAMVAYATVLAMSIWLIQANPHATWRVPVAVAPVVPALFALAAFVRFLSRMDELQRRIQLDAIGLAFGATAVFTFAYGFLENVGAPHLSWIWILPGMVVLWGVGLAVASWRYQ